MIEVDNLRAWVALISIFVFFGFLVMVSDSNTKNTAEHNCMKRWAQSEIRSQYDPHVGCMVHTKQGWVPEDRFRVSE